MLHSATRQNPAQVIREAAAAYKVTWTLLARRSSRSSPPRSRQRRESPTAKAVQPKTRNQSEARTSNHLVCFGNPYC